MLFERGSYYFCEKYLPRSDCAVHGGCPRPKPFVYSKFSFFFQEPVYPMMGPLLPEQSSYMEKKIKVYKIKLEK